MARPRRKTPVATIHVVGLHPRASYWQPTSKTRMAELVEAFLRQAEPGEPFVLTITRPESDES